MTDPDYPGPATALAERIEGIGVAMMTTIGDHGRLRSQPMVAQLSHDSNGLWFFTSTSSPAALNIQQRPAVNLSYVDLAAKRYISVAGRARLVRDSDRIREMWNSTVATWFPKGINDPELTLIEVDVEEADYWDDSNSTFVSITGFLRELMGDKPPHMVDRGHLDMHP